MLDLHAALMALLAMVVFALLTWPVSVYKQDVSIVDSLWSLFFLCGLIAYVAAGGWRIGGERACIVTTLLALWGLRLCLYVTWRNHGEPEDRRYQAIRARNQPGFAWKSVYLVFGLQAVLAWVIAMPLFAALGGDAPINLLDVAGVALWITGMLFESVGDWQLARFKADPANRGRVLDSGLWRYTRHPNYFGEATIWWSFYLFAAAAGAWWTLFAPLVMTIMLLKVSGVALLEKDIGERRPAYREYIARTSVFIPWPPKPSAGSKGGAR
ncbi:MAG: DUF1295 domain-containing protein [Casimicrobiaceae bacterium]